MLNCLRQGGAQVGFLVARFGYLWASTSDSRLALSRRLARPGDCLHPYASYLFNRVVRSANQIMSSLFGEATFSWSELS
jgi:hypothetical protein